MEKQILTWIETLPYPAIAISSGKTAVCRNRLARRLLPPVARLRGHLADFQDNFVKELNLDGISYLVLSFSSEENRLFFFFEQFLPLQEGISRAIVERMQNFFWFLSNDEGIGGCENIVRLDQIAARVHKLRMHGENYLRLINKTKLSENEEPKTCLLKGFFEHLYKALDACGIHVNICDCTGLTVLSESKVLSFLVLNLIYFAHLFDAKKELSLSVTAEEDYIRFSMNISDCGAVKLSLEDLILHDKCGEKLLYTLPMLCILRLCMENGIPWNILTSDGETCFSFLLAKGEKEAVLFLTDVAAEEVSQLLQMIKEIFS